MALKTKSNLRPDLGTSAEVPDVPPGTSMIVFINVVHFIFFIRTSKKNLRLGNR